MIPQKHTTFFVLVLLGHFDFEDEKCSKSKWLLLSSSKLKELKRARYEPKRSVETDGEREGEEGHQVARRKVRCCGASVKAQCVTKFVEVLSTQ